MSGRNRGRATANHDADEERRLWKEIRDKARDVDVMVARSNDIGREIVELEGQQSALAEANKPFSADIDEKLEKLYRENLKLTEDVQQIIEGNSHGTHLLDSITILAGLRAHSEENAATAAASQHQSSQNSSSRSANGKLKRPLKGGASGKNANASAATPTTATATAPVAASLEDGELESAAPSPMRISLSANSSRLTAKDKPSRAGSIPTTREASVKIEDGAESVASSADGGNSTATGKTSSAGGRPTNRLVLKQGEVVFCRHDPKNHDSKKGDPPEGEGILCRVTSVIGEGKQRRYEVQDADPSGETPPPQRASVSQLIQIPETNKGLFDLSHKRKVLAEYPDTTTFYKAEVAEEWLARKANTVERGQYVKLNFHEDDVVREVERRFVLTEK